MTSKKFPRAFVGTRGCHTRRRRCHKAAPKRIGARRSARRLVIRARARRSGSAPAALAPETRAAEELPKLGADLAATSVSGLSSGAYMAGQIQVAHAKDIVGAGIVAGGPFACAESPASRIFPFWPTAVAQNGTQALFQCMKTNWGSPTRGDRRSAPSWPRTARSTRSPGSRRQRLSLLRQGG